MDVPTVRVMAKERVYQRYEERFTRLLTWEMEDVERCDAIFHFVGVSESAESQIMSLIVDDSLNV